MDETKFGKSKYHRGNYREGMWVIGAVDRNTGQCFLIPSPNNSRTAATLLPIIQRWILPVHTDVPVAFLLYNGLTAAGYTHLTVNHDIQFTDLHTNTQEGLWHHVKKNMDGRKSLKNVLVNLMFRRRFNANAEVRYSPT